MKYAYLLVVLCFFFCAEVEAQLNGTYGPAAPLYRMALTQDISSGSVNGQLVVPNTLARWGNNGVWRYRLSYQWTLTDDMIPNGSTINSVRLIFNGSYGNAALYFTAGLSNIELDLQSANAGEVWSRMTDNERALGSENSDPNYRFDHTFTSGSAFCTAVQNALYSDKFILGIFYTGDQLYSNYWNIENWSVSIEVNFTRPTVNVTVDQKLSTSQSAGGNVKRWETSDFIPYSVPYTFQFGVGTTEVLGARQDIVSGEKYHDWNNDLSDVTNHHSFSIVPSFPNILNAYFSPTYSTITIKTELIDAPGITGGNIRFRDPWYIDYPDPQYGNNLRNQGHPGALHTRSSPFYPDFDTPFPPHNQAYRGVFLNENPNFLPDRPYYTVFAPLGQNIAGFTADFVSWSGNPADVTFQDATSEETGVVLKRAGAVVRAMYRATSVTLSYNYTAKWNMLSVPDSVSNFAKSAVWPTSTSDAFWYDTASPHNYVVRDPLKKGEGYWIKFPSSGTVTYTGKPFFSLTVPVDTGWNLIGSISVPLDSTQVDYHSTARTSSFWIFDYNEGYRPEDTIFPWQGALG